MNINFIVDGELIPMNVNPNDLLQKAVIDVLFKAQRIDRPYKEWYAKDDRGYMLQLDRPINDQREWIEGKVSDVLIKMSDESEITVRRFIGENA